MKAALGSREGFEIKTGGFLPVKRRGEINQKFFWREERTKPERRGSVNFIANCNLHECSSLFSVHHLAGVPHF